MGSVGAAVDCSKKGANASWISWSVVGTAGAPAGAPPPGAPPVISVGNLVSGGAGKTPVVAWLATRLSAQGERLVIVARGYGRAPGGPGVRTPKDGADATHLGDELAMLAARGLEVRSSPDRARPCARSFASS